MPARIRFRHWLTVLGVIAALSACSALPSSRMRRVALDRVQVGAASDANGHTATALDLVFVYDPSVLPLIPGEARDWFEHKAQFMGASGTAVDVVSLQLPPTTVIDRVTLPERHARAIAVYAFAGYLSPTGQGRMDLGGYHQVTLWLEGSAVRVSGQ